MQCSCAIDVYEGDCEPVSLWSAQIRTARKPHKCGECRSEIPVGEKYEHQSYLFEGKFWKDKTCLDCVSAREQFYPRGGSCPEGLWNDIKEAVIDSSGEIPEACISMLTPPARAKLCDMIEMFHAVKEAVQ